MLPDESAPRSASLATRLRDGAGGLLARKRAKGEPVPTARRDWWVAAALALLLAAGPLLTIAGASFLGWYARGDLAVVRATLAPRAAQETAIVRDRAEIATVLHRPTLGMTLEALAGAMPTDAALVRAGRDATGLLTVEIAAPDPDVLRAAIRRDPMLNGLRDTGQRQDDARMIVTMQERAR